MTNLEVIYAERVKIRTIIQELEAVGVQWAFPATVALASADSALKRMAEHETERAS